MSADLPGPPDYRDVLACRRLLKHGSRSFFAASLLLPQPYRDDAISLYAFCRQADDAIDDSDDPLAGLAEFNARVDAIYRGDPGPYPEDRAMALLVERCGLPRGLLDALLEGFAWDCDGRTYADFSGLLDYAARVAGAVGVMMAVMMGQREPAVLARAADLGSAMQLTNIVRDIGEDARSGRLYLPMDWLAEHGLDPEALLTSPRHCEPLADLSRRLLAEADRLYRRAEAGIARLPAMCRPCVYAARLLYAEIGREVERQQYDSVSRRAVVSGRRKAAVLTSLGRVVRLPADSLTEPVLAENAFLVAAVEHGPAPRPSAARPSAARPNAARPDAARPNAARPDVAWVLDLFAELDRRERSAVYAVPSRAVRPRPARRPVRRSVRFSPHGAAS